MKRLLLISLLLALPASANIPPIRKQFPHRDLAIKHDTRSKGAWYMSAEGHAIFCYGPTMVIQTASGFQKVATFCKGDKVIVPLHD